MVRENIEVEGGVAGGKGSPASWLSWSLWFGLTGTGGVLGLECCLCMCAGFVGLFIAWVSPRGQGHGWCNVEESVAG